MPLHATLGWAPYQPGSYLRSRLSLSPTWLAVNLPSIHVHSHPEIPKCTALQSLMKLPIQYKIFTETLALLLFTVSRQKAPRVRVFQYAFLAARVNTPSSSNQNTGSPICCCCCCCRFFPTSPVKFEGTGDQDWWRKHASSRRTGGQ